MFSGISFPIGMNRFLRAMRDFVKFTPAFEEFCELSGSKKTGILVSQVFKSGLCLTNNLLEGLIGSII